jgi:glycerophosphoryl diester phosphodiesterase
MDPRIHQAPPRMYASKKKKRFSWTWVYIVLASMILLYFTLFLLVVPERPYKSFLVKGDRPLVIAHRGGAALAPENTMVAFAKAQSIGVDAIEYDVHMTKDGQLVVIHDETVDRTTNGKGRVDQFTLHELRQLDAAHSFQDIRGNYIYRGQGVKIPTVEEVLLKFSNIRHNIEIKDAYPIGAESEIEEKLWKLIKDYGMEDQVLVVSFSEDIMVRFNQFALGKVAIAAPKQETTRFVVYHKLFLNRLYRPTSDALQIPTEANLFNLTEHRLIKGAQKLNIRVYYWTIDDEQTMRELLLRGADGLITNRPDLLIRVINEMEALNGNH